MEDKEKIEVLSALVARHALMGRMGMTYNDERNLYETLGYKTDLTDDDYYSQYTRQDIAKAIIDRPAKATWSGNIIFMESSTTKDTECEKAWNKLEEDFKIKSIFLRLDKLTCLGTFGVLLMGLNDVTNSNDLSKPVKGKNLKLLYLKPFNSKNAQVITYEINTNSPRYGLPLIYQLQVGIPGVAASKTINVHYSRVIHVVYDELESTIEGSPVLESIFNRLQDLEKLVGGSAEMFWRGARPGYQGRVDPDYQMTPDMETTLKAQIDEYEHNLRRIVVNEGLSLEALESQVHDPSSHVDIQVQMISAVTGIPKRILTGSERGELSSAQDQGQWYGLITERRKEFAEAKILFPFINKCIELGVLPALSGNHYAIQWDDVFTVSDKAKADIGNTRAIALAQYAAQPLAESIVPAEAFFEFFLGLSTSQIELIMEMKKKKGEFEAEDFVKARESLFPDQEKINEQKEKMEQTGGGQVGKTVAPAEPKEEMKTEKAKS